MPELDWLDRTPGQEVWLVRGLLSPGECSDWIALGEAIGFGEAPINTEHGQVRVSEVRNNDRAMRDDPARAAALWSRLAGFVPAAIEPWVAVGLNERFRLYRYRPGQYFAPHRDGCFERSHVEKSLFTLMIYLNEGCEGGETHFFRRAGSMRGSQRAITVVPALGAALLFRHLQVHEGAAVIAGEKYALRSDVMYRWRHADQGE